MSPALLHWIAAYGPPALFGLLFLGVFGLPVPDETLLPFAGVLIRQGRLHLVPTFVAAVLGSMGGITLSYVVGRTFGLGVVDRFGRSFHITRADVARVERWFERSGRWLLMFGYFIPGVRHFTAYAAGISEVSPRSFALFAYSGAIIWVSTFIGLGYFLGDRWKAVEAKM